ncbi:MAG TPA: PKD domain-containing protein [Solirubrobacterales bacterium]|nr:PKD domain-containing protein [Solirubrobacterales bacterium]
MKAPTGLAWSGAVVLCALFLLVPATPAMAAPTWLAPVDLTAAGESVRTAPQVAVDRGGDAVAVWKGYDGADDVIETASRPAGGSWQAPVDLSAAGHDASEPQVAVDPGGDAVAVWKRYDGTDYVVETASRPAGGSWQASVAISATGQNAENPQVAVDPGGDAVAVWKGPDGSKFIVETASRPAGGSWQAPVAISAAGQNAVTPQVAIDPGADAVAVWDRYNGANHIIETASRPAGGSWEAPVDLSVAGRNAETPQVAVDPGGDAVAVWYRDNGANYIVQAASRPAGGSWEAPVDLSAAGRNAFAPQVAFDPGGDAVAVWENETDHIGETASRPGGGSWQAPADLSAGQEAFAPQVAVDPGGDAVAVWESYDGGYIAQAAAYDATGPQLRSLSIPAAGTVGQSLAFSVSPLDVWSALGPVSWNFGDGAGASGAGVSHTYTAPGNYTVTLSAGDSLGNLSSATAQVSITAAAVIAGPAGAGPPLRPAPKAPPTVEPRASVGRLVLVKDGKALLKLSCAASSGCRGVARLSVVLEASGRNRADAQRASLEIGKAAFKITGAKAKTVPVKLSAIGKARVRAAVKTGGLKARLAGTGVRARTVLLKEAR